MSKRLATNTVLGKDKWTDRERTIYAMGLVNSRSRAEADLSKVKDLLKRIVTNPTGSDQPNLYAEGRKLLSITDWNPSGRLSEEKA